MDQFMALDPSFRAALLNGGLLNPEFQEAFAKAHTDMGAGKSPTPNDLVREGDTPNVAVAAAAAATASSGSVSLSRANLKSTNLS